MLFHKGHVYGLDGSAFVCFDPETGERNWRADGYGNLGNDDWNFPGHAAEERLVLFKVG
jgi:hypothetical protein